MSELDEILSVQGNLVRMIQELTNVSSYKAGSLTGEYDTSPNLSSSVELLLTGKQSANLYVFIKY